MAIRIELAPDEAACRQPEEHPASSRAEEASASAAAALTVITPPTGRPTLVDFGELWRARDLLYFLTLRDVKVRYKQTALGVAWAVLQPALMMVVFTLFFRRMAGVESGGLPYPLFACAGLLPWTFFASAVAGAGNSVIGSERLITKVYFPRLAIPFAAITAAVIDFFIACGLLAAMMFVYGVTPGGNAWAAPLVFLVIFLTSAGVGTFLSALNVEFRDFRYVIPFLLQVWMFATPTIYMSVDPVAGASPGPAARAASAAAAAENEVDPRTRAVLKGVLVLNPMTGLIGAFRAAVLGGRMPWVSLAGSTVGAVVIFTAGCLYFRKVEDRFADII